MMKKDTKERTTKGKQLELKFEFDLILDEHLEEYAASYAYMDSQDVYESAVEIFVTEALVRGVKEANPTPSSKDVQFISSINVLYEMIDEVMEEFPDFDSDYITDLYSEHFKEEQEFLI